MHSLGQVIELCSGCGFEIPGDVDVCPSCRPDAVPALAARQVAGLALPTRSVHRLPITAPRRGPKTRQAGTSGAARSAFGYASLLVIVALLGAISGWAAGLERFVLAVPTGTVAWLADLTELATWAAVIVGAAGLVAVAAGCGRRARVGIARRHERTR